MLTELFNQIDRTVLTSGAANGHRDVVAMVFFKGG
jgi:hypothetical protein